MRVIYSKPELKDLSQGSRIAFIRQFRYMTQDEVSDKLTKKMYTDKTYIVYYGDGQNMLVTGTVDPVVATVKVNSSLASVVIFLNL